MGSYAMKIQQPESKTFRLNVAEMGKDFVFPSYPAAFFTKLDPNLPGDEWWTRTYQYPGRGASNGRNFGGFTRTQENSLTVDSKWPEIEPSVR